MTQSGHRRIESARVEKEVEDYRSRRHRICLRIWTASAPNLKKRIGKEEAAARSARVAKLKRARRWCCLAPTTAHIRMGTPLAARSSVTNAFAQGMFPVLAMSKMDQSSASGPSGYELAEWCGVAMVLLC